MFKLLFYNYYVIILYIPMSLSNFIPDDGSLWSIRAVDISGNYNQKLSLDASGNAIIITGNTDRLTINSSGAWTCQGGMTYNNSTNTLTAGTFSGTATTATNIAGGTASQILYQTAPSTTAFIPNGTAGQVLTSNGTSVPTWVSKAFVFLYSTPAAFASKFYASGTVVFGSLVAPFLSVKSTAGLTNSGTNGWVRTATVGAEGRFYSPTTSQWLVNCVLNYSATFNSFIIARIYNAANVLQSARYMSVNVPNTIQENTFIAEMNAGDYLQFETIAGTGLTIQYEGELSTTLQIREL